MLNCRHATGSALLIALSSLVGQAAERTTSASTDAGPTPATMRSISEHELRSSLYVVRDRALLMNLERARTPDDWLKVPGVKAAWKKTPGIRGKTVLADADRDGKYELYGEGGEAGAGRTMFWCHNPDGAARWETPIRSSTGDNNGVQCEDLDSDGRFEAVSVGNYLTVLDAATGAVRRERFIFADFFGPSDKPLIGDEMRLDNPYRLGHCADRSKWNIVIANGYAPEKKRAGHNYPKGGVQVICYAPDGSIAWHYRHADEKYWGGGHELRVHDLDGDGLEEVIHSSNGGLICINPDGTERWRHEGRLPTPTHSDWISISDVNADGKLEIVVQYNGAKGQFFVLDANTGRVLREIPVVPASEVQNFAVGRFRPDLPGRQLAITTINTATLRLLDLEAARYLEFPVGTVSNPTQRVWNGLDMYNCAAHDTDGDGVDEIYTFTTPKPNQLHSIGKEEFTMDPERALHIGVAAYRGTGELAQYWNFYTPTEDGIRWGVLHWEMRQFVNPPRRYDVDRNGIEEAYLETQPWILLVELANLDSSNTH